MIISTRENLSIIKISVRDADYARFDEADWFLFIQNSPEAMNDRLITAFGHKFSSESWLKIAKERPELLHASVITRYGSRLDRHVWEEVARQRPEMFDPKIVLDYGAYFSPTTWTWLLQNNIKVFTPPVVEKFIEDWPGLADLCAKYFADAGVMTDDILSILREHSKIGSDTLAYLAKKLKKPELFNAKEDMYTKDELIEIVERILPELSGANYHKYEDFIASMLHREDMSEEDLKYLYSQSFLYYNPNLLAIVIQSRNCPDEIAKNIASRISEREFDGGLAEHLIICMSNTGNIHRSTTLYAAIASGIPNIFDTLKSVTGFRKFPEPFTQEEINVIGSKSSTVSQLLQVKKEVISRFGKEPGISDADIEKVIDLKIHSINYKKICRILDAIDAKMLSNEIESIDHMSEFDDRKRWGNLIDDYFFKAMISSMIEEYGQIDGETIKEFKKDHM